MIRIELGDAEAGPPGRYRVAGRELSVRPALARLAPFVVAAAGAGAEGSAPPTEMPPKPGGAPRLIRRVTGVVGDAERPIESWRTPTGYLLAVPGVGTFAVDPGGGEVRVTSGEASDSPLVVSAVLGPVLVFALALRDSWCLHAAAAARGGRAFAFAGPSGIGKSTLAAHLAARVPGWRPLADDVLPIETTSGPALARPDFPQPRWSPARQREAGREPVPLAAVLVLERPRVGGTEVTLRPLAGAASLAALTRHSVGTSLHGPELLARHLAAVGALAERAPLHRLAYPFGEPGLARVEAVLAELAA